MAGSLILTVTTLWVLVLILLDFCAFWPGTWPGDQPFKPLVVKRTFFNLKAWKTIKKYRVVISTLWLLKQASVAGHSKLLIGCVCVYYSYVQVTLCANTVKTYRLELVVDVEGVGEEIMSIPINARSDTFPDVNINSVTWKHTRTSKRS